MNQRMMFSWIVHISLLLATKIAKTRDVEAPSFEADDTMNVDVASNEFIGKLHARHLLPQANLHPCFI
jgi:hypothetical protein